MTNIFHVPSDEAYRALGVLAPGQRWFAFDVSMPEARQRRATKFVMAVWNYHGELKDDGTLWRAIKRENGSERIWYHIPRIAQGQTSNNRKSLCDALCIAAESGIPMQALLKDQNTRRCAPDFVFDIVEVMENSAGSEIWIRLDVLPEQVGTPVETVDLPSLRSLSKEESSRRERSPKLTPEQYTAACEIAAEVQAGRTTRGHALQLLADEQGITEGSASVLLNNYRCLLHGVEIKAPMSADAMRHFVDSIIARHGAEAVDNVLISVQGYLAYSESRGDPSRGINDILNELGIAREAFERLALATTSLKELLPTERGPAADLVSEVLREVWTRGPQHAAFRRELMRRWSKKCSVHESPCNEQLRASHIVAWRLDVDLRGDVNNGLLLSVPLDNLFDRGFVSFGDDGALLMSTKLEPETFRHFGLSTRLCLAWEHLPESSRNAIRRNLARHREFHAPKHTYSRSAPIGLD